MTQQNILHEYSFCVAWQSFGRLHLVMLLHCIVWFHCSGLVLSCCHYIWNVYVRKQHPILFRSFVGSTKRVYWCQSCWCGKEIKCSAFKHTNAYGMSQRCSLHAGDFTFSFLVYGSTPFLQGHLVQILLKSLPSTNFLNKNSNTTAGYYHSQYSHSLFF